MMKVLAITGVLFLVVTASFLAGSCAQSSSDSDDGDCDYLELSPRASSSPAPFCGIVLWQTNSKIETLKASVSLEFSYFYYSDVASDDPAGGYQYDWTVVDNFLQNAKSRGHHGIVRFRDTDPELGIAARSLPDSLWPARVKPTMTKVSKAHPENGLSSPTGQIRRFRNSSFPSMKRLPPGIPTSLPGSVMSKSASACGLNTISTLTT